MPEDVHLTLEWSPTLGLVMLFITFSMIAFWMMALSLLR